MVTKNDKTLSKQDIVDRVRMETGYSRAESTRVVHAVLGAMSDMLVSGFNIELRGFGVFKITRNDAYTGRNPLTGEKVKVPTKFVVRWRASSLLRNLINTSMAKKAAK